MRYRGQSLLGDSAIHNGHCLGPWSHFGLRTYVFRRFSCALQSWEKSGFCAVCAQTNPLNQWFSTGGDFAPQSPAEAMSGDMFGCTMGTVSVV